MANKPKRIRPRAGEVGRGFMRPDAPRADMVAAHVETRAPTTSGALVRESELSVRCHTARTVNEELRALEASCRKIERRLMGKPGDATLTALLARQMAMLQTCINAAIEGRTWRHRSQVAHANHGLRTNRNMAPVWDWTNKG